MQLPDAALHPPDELMVAHFEDFNFGEGMPADPKAPPPKEYNCGGPDGDLTGNFDLVGCDNCKTLQAVVDSLGETAIEVLDDGTLRPAAAGYTGRTLADVVAGN